MREFMPHYDRGTGTWSIIAKDPSDTYWWTYLPDVGTPDKAAETADALTKASRGE